MMDKDKAIRAAKLTAGAVFEKNRAKTAVTRAGGQIAPSKYLPNVPRAVHADGGKVAFQQGNHPLVPDVLYHGNALQIAKKGWTDEIDPEQTQRNMESQNFRAFKPSEHGNYGPGIYLSDSPKIASNFAQGIRADRKEAMPFGQVMKLHVSMKQPFHDEYLKDPAWKDYIKSEIKNALWLSPHNPNNIKESSQQLIQKLDDGTATVRDLFLRDTPDGTMVNQFGQNKIHETIRNSGFDGIIAHGPDGSKEYVAFKPEQVKSAIGNSGKFDPADPDITKAEGGAATAPMFQDIHPSLQGESGAPLDLYHGTTQDKEFEAFDDAKLGVRDVGFFGRGHYMTPHRDTAQLYAGANEDDGTVIGPLHAALKNPYVWDVSDDMKSQGTLRDLQSMGIMRDKNELRSWDNLQQHHIQPFMAEMKKRGHDGVVVKTGHEHLPNGIAEVVAFDPKTIKHTEAEAFDPTDPRIRRDDGGRVTDTDEFRNWFGNSVTHTNGEPHVLYTGTSKDKDFTSHNVGRHGAWFVRDPEAASSYAEQNDSQGYKREGFKLTPANTASRVIPAYVKAENPYTGELPEEYLRDNYKAAQSDWFDTLRAKGHDSWVPASQNGNLVVALKEPQQIKSIFNSGKFDPNQKHMNKADGGRVGYEDGGRSMKLNSRAAKIVSEMKQNRGSVNDLLAMLKGKVKGSELANAGRPSGDTVTKEELAKHFSDAVPKITVERLGGKDSNQPTKFDDYFLPDGVNYREHLLTLQGREKNAPYTYPPHWGDSKNVLAHVRMADRDNGETLHVGEVQSDWGQQARQRGFYDPSMPFRVYDRETKKTKKLASNPFEARDEAIKSGSGYAVEPSVNYHPPEGPYVGDTQQWTDLALKHILTEAAKGGYKRVVFSPGEHSADMYGQRHPISSFSLHRSPEGSGTLGTLAGYGEDGYLAANGLENIKDEEHLASIIGKEHATKLLASPIKDLPRSNTRIDERRTSDPPGEPTHTLAEPDMHMGGQGMIKYYQRNVNAGALKLLQPHDPSIKPEDYDLPPDPMVGLNEGYTGKAYTGFGLPITDKARKSILENGWEAFKDGGTVGAALALTRRFTKDGNGATMALKSKGK
jgi:hypothetical protein